MMSRHHVVAQSLAELMGDTLGQIARVHKHQRGAVLLHKVGNAVHDIAELLFGGDCFELAFGQLEGKVEVSLVTDVDHRRWRAIADEQTANYFDRPLRSAQAYAYRVLAAQRL